MLRLAVVCLAVVGLSFLASTAVRAGEVAEPMATQISVVDRPGKVMEQGAAGLRPGPARQAVGEAIQEMVPPIGPQLGEAQPADEPGAVQSTITVRSRAPQPEAVRDGPELPAPPVAATGFMPYVVGVTVSLMVIGVGLLVQLTRRV